MRQSNFAHKKLLCWASRNIVHAYTSTKGLPIALADRGRQSCRQFLDLAVSDDAPPAFMACWREKLTRHPALFTVFLNWFFHYCIINDFSRTRPLCPARMEGDIDRRHRAGHIHHLLAAFLCAGPLLLAGQRGRRTRYTGILPFLTNHSWATRQFSATSSLPARMSRLQRTRN